jgi:hypothetical protein
VGDWLDRVAPGLSQLPDTLSRLSPAVDAIRTAFERQDFSSLMDIGVDGFAVLVLIFAVFWLMLAVLVRQCVLAVQAAVAPKKKTPQTEDEIRVRRRPWYRRLAAWRRNFFKQPWYWFVGGVMTFLDQTHALIVGGSGSGKSTAVVSMILQPTIGLKMFIMRKLGIWKRRPVVILSFDRSDPIEQATNELEDLGVRVLRWRIRMGLGWNVLDGDREMIAEAIPTIWSESPGSTGFFSQLMSDAISQALGAIDALGRQRTWREMITRCDSIMEDDDEVPDLARRTWIRRLKSLERVCGQSLGNDFDLVTELRKGAVVHLSGNSYTNPKLTPLVGVAGIVQCKRAAEVVRDVILILEEAAFLKNRRTEMDDLFRSMRARGWRILYLSQDPQDLGPVLEANAAVALIMGLGPLARKSRQWVEDVLKDLPGLKVRASEIVLNVTLDQLEGYLVAGRKGVQAVSLAEYITDAAEHRETVVHREEVDELVPIVVADDGLIAASEGLQHSADELDAGEVDAGAEDGDREQDLLDNSAHKPIVYGPLPMPSWFDGHRLKEDQRDTLRLLEIFQRETNINGVDGCIETSYSLNQEGSNGRPRAGYMGKSWLVYALLLAVREGLDLNEVRMLMEAKVLSCDHECDNNRCVRVSHLRWKAPGDNAKIWHAHRRKALARWQSEVDEVEAVVV